MYFYIIYNKKRIIEIKPKLMKALKEQFMLLYDINISKCSKMIQKNEA